MVLSIQYTYMNNSNRPYASVYCLEHRIYRVPNNNEHDRTIIL